MRLTGLYISLQIQNNNNSSVLLAVEPEDDINRRNCRTLQTWRRHFDFGQITLSSIFSVLNGHNVKTELRK